MEIGIKRRGGGVGMEKLTDRETEATCDGKDKEENNFEGKILREGDENEVSG